MNFNRNQPYNDLPSLPPQSEVETIAIMRSAIKANRALAELKSKGRTLPNQSVLINNLVLLEAKDSSEIENIFTTHDKLYQSDVMDARQIDSQTKEVKLYREALWNGVNSIKVKPLSTNTFVEIFQIIKQTDAGIRTGSGTKIASPSGEIIYSPPEGEDLLRQLLKNLEIYLHADDGVDPLIKMAIMHYQFEAIHPFTDGNGRTGRILNILYLLHQGLLETPVLFLSSHIIANKIPYYQGLKAVTENGAWESWILYMLDAVEQTSIQTMQRIERIEETIDIFVQELKSKASKIYTRDLVELLFQRPYCRIQNLVDGLSVERRTASRYLKKLEEIGLMVSVRQGTEIIFFNPLLINQLRK